MRTLILLCAGIALAIWSLFAWGVYALLGFSGEIAAGSAWLFPVVPPEILYWVAQLLGGMGGAIVWVVWALGAGLIVLLTLIPLAFLRRRPRYHREDEGFGPGPSHRGGYRGPDGGYRGPDGPLQRYSGPPPRDLDAPR